VPTFIVLNQNQALTFNENICIFMENIINWKKNLWEREKNHALWYF